MMAVCVVLLQALVLALLPLVLLLLLLLLVRLLLWPLASLRPLSGATLLVTWVCAVLPNLPLVVPILV